MSSHIDTYTENQGFRYGLEFLLKFMGLVRRKNHQILPQCISLIWAYHQSEI